MDSAIMTVDTETVVAITRLKVISTTIYYHNTNRMCHQKEESLDGKQFRGKKFY